MATRDNKQESMECPECQEKLIHQSACCFCQNCGYSRCN